MGRPKANPEQNLRAYQLWRESNGPTAIEEALTKEFENPVSGRTIASWVKRFKDLREDTINLDSPYQWNRTEEYGLSWEAGGFILDMLAVVHESNADHAKSIQKYDRQLPDQSIPTIREVLWWWRVHQACPEIGWKVGNLEDIQCVSAHFVYRDLSREILGQAIGFSDLEACLALKPWLSERRHKKYHQMVSLGVVPPFKDSDFRSPGSKLIDLVKATRGRPSQHMSWLFWLIEIRGREHPELLRSQPD